MECLAVHNSGFQPSNLPENEKMRAVRRPRLMEKQALSFQIKTPDSTYGVFSDRLLRWNDNHNRSRAREPVTE